MVKHMNLEQKAARLIKEYGMIGGGDIVLAAFSGGSDSSALLFFLLKFFGGNTIYAAHLNHMMRGADADADERFAAEMCERYNVPLFTGRCDIPDIAKKTKTGAEEAARTARYEFFRQIAAKIGGSVKIATAHTASDNTESVLFNLARGCGLDGLRGAAPVNANIIRPLLSCTSEDVLEYCEQNNIAYITDKSNADEAYTRNFIRHSVASKLKEKFAGLDENIFKTSEIMRGAGDFLDACADSVVGGGALEVPLGVILPLHTTLRRAVIARLYENAAAPEYKKLEYKHILYAEGLLEFPGKQIDLPGFVTARVSGGKLSFYRDENKLTSQKRR